MRGFFLQKNSKRDIAAPSDAIGRGGACIAPAEMTDAVPELARASDAGYGGRRFHVIKRRQIKICRRFYNCELRCADSC
jgi:hypothetical protein